MTIIEKAKTLVIAKMLDGANIPILEEIYKTLDNLTIKNTKRWSQYLIDKYLIWIDMGLQDSIIKIYYLNGDNLVKFQIAYFRVYHNEDIGLFKLNNIQYWHQFNEAAEISPYVFNAIKYEV